MENQSIIYEIVRSEHSARVSAMDSISQIEVFVLANPHLTDRALRDLATAKLLQKIKLELKKLNP